jgi:hypothetical protein
MGDLQSQSHSDLVEQIPDPDTVRSWLAESNRRSELLRSLLRVAIRKAAFDRATDEREEEVPLGR